MLHEFCKDEWEAFKIADVIYTSQAISGSPITHQLHAEHREVEEGVTTEDVKLSGRQGKILEEQAIWQDQEWREDTYQAVRWGTGFRTK